MVRRPVLLLPFLLAVFVSGCGGGSGGHASDGGSTDGGMPVPVAPSVSVEWPARTRGFEAPTTANAAQFRFLNPTTFASVLTYAASRPSGTAATTQAYVGPQAIAPGDYALEIDFFLSTGGAVTGTARLAVRLAADGSLTRPDGAPLGTIAYQGKIDRVQVDPGQRLDVGQTRDLTFTASIGGGALVALPYGVARLEVVDGADRLRVNADGSVTGLAGGEARVRMTIDKTLSAETVVFVNGPALPAQVVDFAGTDLAWNPASGALWATYASRNGSAVARVDGGVAIPVDFGPTVAAISDDGSTMAIGLFATGEVQYVDLVAGTPGPRFTLPANASAQTLAFAPGSRSVLAVGTRSSGTSGSDGVAIYDGATRRASAATGRNALSLAWVSGARLVATDETSIYDVSVEAGGATFGGGRAPYATFGNGLRALGVGAGRIYTSAGTILDETTLASIGTVSRPGASAGSTPGAGPVVDVAANRVWYVEGTNAARLRAYRLDDGSLLDDRSIANGEGTPANPSVVRLVRRGARGLAVQVGTKLVLLDDVPGF